MAQIKFQVLDDHGRVIDEAELEFDTLAEALEEWEALMEDLDEGEGEGDETEDGEAEETGAVESEHGG